MELWYWDSILFAAIIWAALLLLVDIKRIKELLPVGLLSSVLFFSLGIYLESIGLARFSNGFLTIFGTPFFHLVWTFAAGILLLNYLQRNFSRKVLVVFMFSIFGLVLDVFSVMVGGHIHSSNYNFIHSFIIILTTTVFFVWIAEGLFEERIYGQADFRLK